jgi:hypothetical protein
MNTFDLVKISKDNRNKYISLKHGKNPHLEGGIRWRK